MPSTPRYALGEIPVASTLRAPRPTVAYSRQPPWCGDDVALGEARAARRHDLAHGGAVSVSPSCNGGSVGLCVVHPPAHVRVDRHEGVADDDLAVARVADLDFSELEVGRLRLALGREASLISRLVQGHPPTR